MKNRRRIIIALVLVAVFAVGAVLYLTVLGPALEPEETVKIPIETQQGEAIDTTDRIQIFPRITAENVQSISVKNEYDSFEIYRDPNNDFRIKGHEHLSLRTTKVSELISIAGYPLARKKIDSSAQEYEQYGLNAPVAEWTITDKAGETHTLNVGHRLLTDDGYYICLDGRGAVYELSTSIETTILLQAHDYVNPLLMAAAPTNKYYDIDRFTISHGKEKFISFSLVDEKDKKNPDSLAEAAMTYPAEYVPNEDRVWTVYSLMTGFSGESVVEIGADEKVYAEYGLDEPEYTVAFEYDGRGVRYIFLGTYGGRILLRKLEHRAGYGREGRCRHRGIPLLRSVQVDIAVPVRILYHADILDRSEERRIRPALCAEAFRGCEGKRRSRGRLERRHGFRTRGNGEKLPYVL